MNQRLRQKAKNSVEQNFFKLLNNGNFGYDCHNNLDSCTFEPIYYKIKKILKDITIYFTKQHRLFLI